MDTVASAKDLLLQVLSIARYAKDKGRYADEFIFSCQLDALVDTASSCSSFEQEEIRNVIKTSNQEAIIAVLKKYIDTQIYQQRLQQRIMEAIDEIIQNLAPRFSETQKKELSNLLNKKRRDVAI